VFIVSKGVHASLQGAKGLITYFACSHPFPLVNAKFRRFKQTPKLITYDLFTKKQTKVIYDIMIMIIIACSPVCNSPFYSGVDKVMMATH